MRYLLFLVLAIALYGFDHNATFVDQFDQQKKLTKEDKALIIVFDKASYYDVLDFLDTKPKDYLSRHHICFINDISGMPSSIYTLFVRPRMQKIPYPLMLVKDKVLSKTLPYKDDKITYYDLNSTKVNFIKGDELKRVLPQ